MSDDTNGQEKVNPDSPVPKEELDELQSLQESRLDLADRLLKLEMERIRILAAAKRVNDQHQLKFEALLAERGLDPSTPVEINASTGKITIDKEEEEPVV